MVERAYHFGRGSLTGCKEASFSHTFVGEQACTGPIRSLEEALDEAIYREKREEGARATEGKAGGDNGESKRGCPRCPRVLVGANHADYSANAFRPMGGDACTTRLGSTVASDHVV